jgi:hypothetical protein
VSSLRPPRGRGRRREGEVTGSLWAWPGSTAVGPPPEERRVAERLVSEVGGPSGAVPGGW